MSIRSATMHARAAASLLLAITALGSWAQSTITPREGTWIVNNFRFHTGATLPELKLHYSTLGNPAHDAVLVLHGTTGSGTGLLGPAFGGELFGAGQPLDASK